MFRRASIKYKIERVKKDRNSSYFTIISAVIFTVIFTADKLVFDCAKFIVYMFEVGIHRWPLEPGNKWPYAAKA